VWYLRQLETGSLSVQRASIAALQVLGSKKAVPQLIVVFQRDTQSLCASALSPMHASNSSQVELIIDSGIAIE